jgi:hypothetical protein
LCLVVGLKEDMTEDEQEALWRARRDSARREMTAWLRRSVEVRPAADAFQSTYEERVLWEDAGRGQWRISVPWQVQRKYDELCHEPKVPCAEAAWRGEDTEEQRIAAKIRRICREHEQRPEDDTRATLPDAALGFARLVAAKYAEQHRCYYTLPGLAAAKKGEKADNSREAWQGRLMLARAAHDHEFAWLCELALKGVPKQASTFYVEPLHSIRRPINGYVRNVKVHSAATSRSWLVALEPDDYSSPDKLRRKLNADASGAWLTGQDVWNLVISDWEHVLQWNEAELVTEMGWHNPSLACEHGRPITPAGAWFFGDGAVDAYGIEHVPDADGILLLKCPNRDTRRGFEWRKFKVSSFDETGTKEFILGRPELGLRDGQNPRRVSALAVDRVRELFSGFTDRTLEVVGNMDALAGLGITAAFAAAPEVYERHHKFPGIWNTGEANQGKTTLMEWWALIYGIRQNCSLSGSTGPGTESVLQQFSNLPAPLDEAQTEMNRAQVEVVKNAFERKPPAKRTEYLRRVLTTPFVSGVATGDTIQLRSRYLHILVSEQQRLPRPGQPKLDPVTGLRTGEAWDESSARLRQNENYTWMESNRAEFCSIGRWLLRNRGIANAEQRTSNGEPLKEGGASAVRSSSFAPAVLAHLHEFLTHPDTLGLNSRAKFLHGVAWAGFKAAAESVGLKTVTYRGVRLPLAEVLDLYWRHLLQRTRESEKTAKEAAELDQFWQEILKCWKLEGFGETPDEWRKFFKVVVAGTSDGPPDCAPDSAQRGSEWVTYHLLLRPDMVLSALQEHMRRRNETLKLRLTDIKQQLSGKTYWHGVAANARQRFGKGDGPVGGYWRVNLDLMAEFGRRTMGDDEYLRAHQAVNLEVVAAASREAASVGGILSENMLEQDCKREWAASDPRKGPLYELIHALLEKEK